VSGRSGIQADPLIAFACRTSGQACGRGKHFSPACDTVKVARSALHIPLALWERDGVRETVMVSAAYIYRGGAGAMTVRRGRQSSVLLRSFQNHPVGLHASIEKGEGRSPKIEPESTVQRLAPAADDFIPRGLQILGPGLAGEVVRDVEKIDLRRSAQNCQIPARYGCGFVDLSRISS
jgi:hypothetical protein